MGRTFSSFRVDSSCTCGGFYRFQRFKTVKLQLNGNKLFSQGCFLLLPCKKIVRSHCGCLVSHSFTCMLLYNQCNICSKTHFLFSFLRKMSLLGATCIFCVHPKWCFLIILCVFVCVAFDKLLETGGAPPALHFLSVILLALCLLFSAGSILLSLYNSVSNPYQTCMGYVGVYACSSLSGKLYFALFWSWSIPFLNLLFFLPGSLFVCAGPYPVRDKCQCDQPGRRGGFHNCQWSGTG